MKKGVLEPYFGAIRWGSRARTLTAAQAISAIPAKLKAVLTTKLEINMSKQTTLYADSIGNTTLIDGVIRFDLVRATQVENEKATVEPVATIAMSLPALLRTYEQMSIVINRLVEQGILKKTEAKPPVKEEV